ncbi:NUDIX hydrolase [Paenibacillus sp. F6_3S_P_1C]|uniref:NUDIX hydrolase n=1 Tax=Paenibacillus vandeheii TaxID=3035917 RepID=A0ABT8JJ19_9BACL|nr:NUDIX hydrolase [Paenibacillus vandeheii]MDN4604124.1 NUDIX hydrolase [Paenibacillus vandeheii]
MEIRQMATAFLSNGTDMLMMKKAGSKLFNFEFWGGIGGHLEHGELNSPMTASYREIEEETGFKQEDVENFRLRYILLEVNGNEVRQQFVYFGETKHRSFIPSDEGELFWVPLDELLDLHTSILIKASIRHFLQNQETNEIWIGNVLNGEGSAARPRVEWSIMQDTISFETVV